MAEEREVPITETKEFQAALEAEKAEIKAALAKANDERKKERLELKKLREALGDDFDVEAYRDLVAEKEERERAAAKTREEFDALLAKRDKTYATEAEKLNGTIGTLRGQLEGLMRTDRVRQALEGAGAFVDLALPHVESRVHTELGDDGQLRVSIADIDGSPMLDSKGQQITEIGVLVEHMRDSPRFAPLFQPSGTSGGGAPAAHVARGGTKTKPFTEWTEAEKVQYVNEHGSDKYIELIAGLPVATTE